MREQKQKRKCKGCGKDISHKHPNAKFHSRKCKDKYHNVMNPRGFYAHLNENSPEYIHDQGCADMEYGWDGHKDTF